MENKNIPPFYVGQKVEYITGNNMPKYSKHIVSNVYKSPCGCWMIDINNTSKIQTLGEHSYWECCECKGKIYDYNFYGWYATSFRPIQEQTFPLMTYSKVIEKELVSAN